MIDKNLSSSDYLRLTKVKQDFDQRISGADIWRQFSDRFEAWKTCTDACTNSIPPIVHQIWLGSTPPQKYDDWRRSWKKLNPSFEYRLWDEKAILGLGDFKSRKAYSFARSYGVKSDIARYEILKRFGGIYADTDFECLRPFDYLIERSSLMVGNLYGYEPEICNAIIAACPGHWLLDTLCEKTSKIILTTEPLAVIDATGPGLLTREIIDNLPRMSAYDVVLPADYFYPFPNYVKDLVFGPDIKGKYVDDSAYAIHYWEVSWSKVGPVDWVIRKGIRGVKKVFRYIARIGRS